MPLKNQVQLIVYPNRIGKNLADLYEAIEPLEKEVKGLHILPLFPSNADAGFSPLTHMEVDPEYGSLEDLKKITTKYDLCLDLVLNHISDQSPKKISPKSTSGKKKNPFEKSPSPMAKKFGSGLHLPTNKSISITSLKKPMSSWNVICDS